MNLIPSGLSGLMLVAEVKPIGQVADIRPFIGPPGHGTGDQPGRSSRQGRQILDIRRPDSNGQVLLRQEYVLSSDG